MNASPPLNLPIGTRVLIGRFGISTPDDWWLATVLWTDGAEVLVSQYGVAGREPHNALHDIGLVRAVGDLPFLLEFKRQASEAVGSLNQTVGRAELALGAARDAVWERLREIGAHRPGIETPETKVARRRRAARKRIGLEPEPQEPTTEGVETEATSEATP